MPQPRETHRALHGAARADKRGAPPRMRPLARAPLRARRGAPKWPRLRSGGRVPTSTRDGVRQICPDCVAAIRSRGKFGGIGHSVGVNPAHGERSSGYFGTGRRSRPDSGAGAQGCGAQRSGTQGAAKRDTRHRGEKDLHLVRAAEDVVLVVREAIGNLEAAQQLAGVVLAHHAQRLRKRGNSV